MHYYKFNIGDYASHTAHLTPIEDLAYRRLIDHYYLHEKPIQGDPKTISRDIGLKDHLEDVTFILEKYFIHADGAWSNKRADFEIEEFQSKRAQQSKAGKASAEARAKKTGKKKFAMTKEWRPQAQSWQKNCFLAEIEPLFENSLLHGFITYWTEEGNSQTEEQWQLKLIAHLKKNKKAAPKPSLMTRLQDRTWADKILLTDESDQ